MPYVYVPKRLLPTVYALLLEGDERAGAAEPEFEDTTQPESTPEGFNVLDFARLGVNTHKVLDVIAKAAPEWVGYSGICDATGLTSDQVKGGLGAIGRVNHGKKELRPYTIRWSTEVEEWEYRMDAATARRWLDR